MGDAAINATANGTTDLPTESDTYYTEDGTKISKAVTYVLTEEATQKIVSLGSANGQQTVTIPSTLKIGDKFTLSATANDTSDSCTVTVTVVSAGASAITGPVIGKGQVTFYFQDDNYKLVKVKGEMTPNDCKPIPMEYDSETRFWTLTYDVLPGTYSYGFEKFKDGDDLSATGDWVKDPLNDSGKVTVTESPERTSPKIEGKTVTFSYKAQTAEKVYIAGNMNNYDATMPEESEYKLTKNESADYWELTRKMSAGSYDYKIVAAFGLGVMCLRDPLNPNKQDKNDPNSTFVTAGLADGEVVMNRARAEAELKSELDLFDEKGDSSPVAVTYDLSDETKAAAYKDAVKVIKDEKSGKTKVTITDEFPENVIEFTLTATDANNNTSKVTVSIVE